MEKNLRLQWTEQQSSQNRNRVDIYIVLYSPCTRYIIKYMYVVFEHGTELDLPPFLVFNLFSFQDSLTVSNTDATCLFSRHSPVGRTERCAGSPTRWNAQSTYVSFLIYHYHFMILSCCKMFPASTSTITQWKMCKTTKTITGENVNFAINENN